MSHPHDKPATHIPYPGTPYPSGEPQSVRDAYDQQQDSQQQTGKR